MLVLFGRDTLLTDGFQATKGCQSPPPPPPPRDLRGLRGVGRKRLDGPDAGLRQTARGIASHLRVSGIDPRRGLPPAMIYALVPTWCRHDFGSVGKSSTKWLKLLAGAGGFEPPHGGIKIRCLTAWRRPNVLQGWLGPAESGRTIVRAFAHRNGSRRDLPQGVTERSGQAWLLREPRDRRWRRIRERRRLHLARADRRRLRLRRTPPRRRARR
jgi:hypothetical protein